MPVDFFTVEPSADIHLSIGTYNGARNEESVTLRLNVYEGGAPRALVNLPYGKVTFDKGPTNVIDPIGADGRIKANRAGIEFARVTWDDHAATAYHQLVLRVSVHADLWSVWMGNNGVATVHDGADDLVLSVFAKFSDGTVGDIAGHGFVAFTSLHPGIATVDQFTGRVFGVSEGTATIRGTFRTMGPFDTQVTVVPPSNAVHPIVERVRYSGSGIEKTNILFLSEGFTQNERGKFKRMVRRVASRMRRSRAHEPFRLLRDSYNIWMAFDPALENGISVGPPIDEHSAGDPGIDASHPPQAHDKPMQVRASNLGLMYGRRMGDRTSQPFGALGQAPMDATWYDGIAQLSYLLNDYRRTRSDIRAWKTDMFAYLSSLQAPDDPNNHYVGLNWAEDAPDQGRVVVIVNDDFMGGYYPVIDTEYGVVYLWGAASYGQKRKFNLIPTSHDGLDHRPSGIPTLREATVAVAIHELCHSFLLGDEYEGNHPFPAGPMTAGIEWAYNLTTRELATAGAGDPFIKWAEITRVSQASGIRGDHVARAGNVEVEMFPGEGSRWVAGPDVLRLRTPNCNMASVLPTAPSISAPTQPIYEYYPKWHRHEPREYHVRITAVNGDTVTLEEAPGSPVALTDGTQIPSRSVLYTPKTEPDGPGSELTLVLPGVLDVVTGNVAIAGGPPPNRLMPLLDKGGACAVPNFGFGYPPPGIPDVTYPKRTETLIGVYEGAGTYNCDVFRPSGMSKMRNEEDTKGVIKFVHHVPLCHLSRYVIVNQINPSRHEALDLLYPGEPA